MHDYRGRKVVEQLGQTNGMLSLVALLPEEKLGLVVLTNSMLLVGLPHALAYKVFYAYLGAPERDWSAILRKEIDVAATRRNDEGLTQAFRQ